jgi:predicted component of type VI protein secretion system
VEAFTLDDYSMGSVQLNGRKEVLADGLQATPGTGAIAVGDYVVAGTLTAKGTALADESSMKVTKATQQPGVTEAGAVTDVNDQLKVAMFAWRVVSLGSAGTGAVGTKIVVERVSIL